MKLLLKSKLTVLAIIAFAYTSEAQNEIELVRSRLKYQGLEISVKDAKQIALEAGSTAAYNDFSKAKKMRLWNSFYSIYGGWNIGAGLVQTLNENPLGPLNLVAGGLLASIPYWPNRKARYNLYLESGIKAYNSSLKSE
jgi:hypothetical protein